MPVPDELLIAGAIVGLAGGSIGIISGIDNLVRRVKTSRKEKRDAEVRLDVDWGTYARHDGPEGANFPVAVGKLLNHGKVAVFDVEVEASTGWAEAYRTLSGAERFRLVKRSVKDLPAPGEALLDIAMVNVHRADGKFRASDTPYVIGTVKLSVTWRIDGTSERSKPIEFEHSYAVNEWSAV